MIVLVDGVGAGGNGGGGSGVGVAVLPRLCLGGLRAVCLSSCDHGNATEILQELCIDCGV